MKKVAIVGAGVMGSGIAYASVTAGYEVIVYDLNKEVLYNSQKQINALFEKGLNRGKITEDEITLCNSRLRYTSEFTEIKADFILEAIVEKLDIKKELFKNLEAQNSPDCILATNTSSIPITQISRGLKFPNRVVGVHFFNPAHIMKLVEIIKGAATDNLIAEKAFNWANSLNKTAVYAQDSPGFIVNRVARHFYVESLKVLEENVTDFETIDRLIESTGFKMGPFRLMDLIGVETNYSVTSSMYEQFGFDSKFRPSRIQKQKVDAGFHGRKSGRGFYSYEE